MSGVYTIFTRNRAAPGTGEYEATVLPNDNSHVGRYGVIYAHGYTGQSHEAIDINGNPGAARLVNTIAASGLAVVSSEFAYNSFANSTSMTRIATARTFLASLGCDPAKILFVGNSMGNWLACRYAADNPGEVAGVIALQPGIDIDYCRDNNVLSSRNDINTAWGLAAGSTSSTVPFPTAGKPLERGADLQGLEYRAYYSSADTISLPATVTELVDIIGSTASKVQVAGTPAHGNAVVAAADKDDIAQWLLNRAS